MKEMVKNINIIKAGAYDRAHGGKDGADYASAMDDIGKFDTFYRTRIYENALRYNEAEKNIGKQYPENQDTLPVENLEPSANGRKKVAEHKDELDASVTLMLRSYRESMTKKIDELLTELLQGKQVGIVVSKLV